MGWSGERNRDHDLLMRIAALLYAFSGLAERVGSLPPPVRSAALWFLRPAEAVAWEFVTGQTCPEIPHSHRRDEGAEATRLALAFRALAHALEMRAAARRFPSDRPERPRHILRRQLRVLACDAPKLDSS